MPCYYPITAFQAHSGGPLSFVQRNDYNTLTIPCGQCSGCRLKKSRDWAIRCVHEKQMHKRSCFCTFTYSPENLPPHNTLVYRDFQLLMMRIRKAHGKGITFYMAGEYGETFGRPHYHALLFGLDFPDRIYLRTTPSGAKIYRSPTLETHWTLGFSSVGDLTFESAAYVARYIMKKRNGDGEKRDYKILDLDTGEIVSKRKEFNQMSRARGIGASWLAKYAADVYTTGKVIIRGHKNNPPRYYDKLFKKIDQGKLEELQYGRFIEALAQSEHHTPERLAVQEQVALAKTKSLKRNLDGS